MRLHPPHDSSTKLLYPVDDPVVLIAVPIITAGCTLNVQNFLRSVLYYENICSHF